MHVHFVILGVVGVITIVDLRWNLRVVVEVGGFLFMALQIEYHIITAI
jgi:hypothetical protein